jgi:hypothetical protein
MDCKRKYTVLPIDLRNKAGYLDILMFAKKKTTTTKPTRTKLQQQQINEPTNQTNQPTNQPK